MRAIKSLDWGEAEEARARDFRKAAVYWRAFFFHCSTHTHTQEERETVENVGLADVGTGKQWRLWGGYFPENRFGLFRNTYSTRERLAGFLREF